MDNKPGGAGSSGPATMAASAKPDGYTIAQMPISVVRIPIIQKTTFETMRDFTYISRSPATRSASQPRRTAPSTPGLT